MYHIGLDGSVTYAFNAFTTSSLGVENWGCDASVYQLHRKKDGEGDETYQDVCPSMTPDSMTTCGMHYNVPELELGIDANSDFASLVTDDGGSFTFRLGWYETYAYFTGQFCYWDFLDDADFSVFYETDPTLAFVLQDPATIGTVSIPLS